LKGRLGSGLLLRHGSPLPEFRAVVLAQLWRRLFNRNIK